MEWSRPARGAWVEITNRTIVATKATLSRPARGAWVEIIKLSPAFSLSDSRAPQGARGLK